MLMTSLSAVPMVEAMAALVLVDQLMAQIAQCELFPINIDLQRSVGEPINGSLKVPTESYPTV